MVISLSFKVALHSFLSFVLALAGGERHFLGLNIYIHIFIYIDIYKYKVYNTIMIHDWIQKVKRLIQICFPLKKRVHNYEYVQ